MLVTISEFTPVPPIRYPGTNPTVRGWYSNDFVAGDQLTPVFGGDGRTGYYYEIECSIDEDGNVVIPAFEIQATTESSPTGRFFLQLFDDTNAPKNMIMGEASGWAIPTQFGATINFYQIALYNQTIFLVNELNNVFTADQTTALIRSMIATLELATDEDAGVVFLSTPADLPSDPVVWGFNDPLVRNAIKMQSVDISDTAPTNGQLLTYNQAANRAEWSTAGFGLGNVVSNEITSVDGQLALMSGTGGKAIRKATQSGFAVLDAGALSTQVLEVREIPSGVIDGVNETFTLAHTPVEGSESVYLQGVLQNSNAAFVLDYEIVDDTITFQPGHIPAPGNSILVTYRYVA